MSRPEDSLRIVRAMGDYLPRFIQFRETVAPNLQATAKIGEDTFTSHGYDHCVRILRHLNSLLEGHTPFFDDIKPEELFCLGVAILLHDVVMSKDPSLRTIHSREGRRIIREEFERAKGSLPAFQLADPVVDAIADVVRAHSDVKNEAGSVIERTLEAVKDQTQSGESGTIRTYILAALLRFGDELDCTSDRIREAQRLIAQEQVARNRYWRMCALIREIKPPDASRTDIVLNINDLALDESDDKANDLALIRRVLQKLQASLEEVNSIVFRPKGIAWWHFNTVRLTDESQALIAVIESQDPLGRAVEDGPASIGQPSNVSSPGAVSESRQGGETDEVASADKGISRKLNDWVMSKKMLRSGHFSISPGRHARDWIDTSQLLENSFYLGQIVDSFINILKQSDDPPESDVLVGVGFPGLIIAAQMSFVGGYGCSYMIPVHDGDKDEKYSRLPDIPESKGLVLVTDVVVEGQTLRKAIEYLSEKYRVSSERVRTVLTVFYRKPTRPRSSIADAINATFKPLNTDFPIQLCDKEVKDCVLHEKGLVEVINEVLVDRGVL